MLGRGALVAQQVSAAAQSQIASLLAEKASRTPAQQKMDSQLIYFAAQSGNQAISAVVKNLQVDLNLDQGGQVLVDIKGTVSPELLAFIGKSAEGEQRLSQV